MAHFDFIDIGTSDFQYSKPKGSQTGIYVEPIKQYIDSIPDYPQCIKENIAIFETTGFVDIYYVPLDVIIEKKLPTCFRGCNSINSPHRSVHDWINSRGWNVEDFIKKYSVKCMTIHDLFVKHNVSSIGTLKIDTEGYDCHIVNQLIDYLSTNDLSLNRLTFETNELAPKDLINKTVERLNQNNFTTISLSNIDSSFTYQIKG
jgi:hypothetical protein